jgi:trehalose 6-phosphate synthase
LPYNFPSDDDQGKPKRNVGGLVNALEPLLVRRGGMWVGWDGITMHSASDVEEAASLPRTISTDNGIRLLGVPLSESELESYYHGFCNRTLWPLFHGLVDTTFFRPEYFTSYVKVNRRFADMLLAHVGTSDRVWLHDYHLLLVPRMLRERGFSGRIDLFMHIPFPPSEVFRALPWRKDLLEGFLAADTVVFHVEPYRDNFVNLTTELIGAVPTPADQDGRVVVHHERGATVVASAPIGIDVDEYETRSRKPEVRALAEKIRREHGGRQVLFGADRLDYTKGILERFRAIDRMLTLRPETAGTFDMVQVVVPSRHQVQEYRELKEKLDREVGRINGVHARTGWIPLHYQFRALSRDELVAWYLAARVALVTPLRDGMNLVAPEFVASRTDEQGALVLSEFAGVSRILGQALIVNPYDLDGCAEAVHEALTMTSKEQRSRMVRMRERVKANTVSHWADRCIGLKIATQEHSGVLPSEGTMDKVSRTASS